MENKLELAGCTLWLITSPILMSRNILHHQMFSVQFALYAATFLIALWILISKLRKRSNR